MNLHKLILRVLSEDAVEAPTKPTTKPGTDKPTKPSKTPFRRPGPGHAPAPDAKKKDSARLQKEIEAFNKRHGTATK